MYPTLKFPKTDETQFFSTLRQRVNNYFNENQLSKSGDSRMIWKTVFMLSLYLVPFALILTNAFPAWGVLLLYMVMGFGMSGIGLSIMHDANHGAYSKNKWVNTVLGHTTDFVGASSFTWKVQHNILHHTYTNIYEMDEDIHDKPILRLSPYGKLKPIHRFQHWYAFALYSLATLGWVTRKDFAQLRVYNQNGLTVQSGHQPKRELRKMILWKIFYFSYILVLPMLLLSIGWGYVLLGFVLMHMVSGILITTIFQLAHVVEGPSHHQPEASGTMENTWAIHQLQTTANFARNNRFISWFVGGLNFQIEHHLFPHICHVHYKSISKIVRNTAREFGLPYHDYPTFGQAIASHLRVLKQLGSGMYLVDAASTGSALKDAPAIPVETNH